MYDVYISIYLYSVFDRMNSGKTQERTIITRTTFPINNHFFRCPVICLYFIMRAISRWEDQNWTHLPCPCSCVRTFRSSFCNRKRIKYNKTIILDLDLFFFYSFCSVSPVMPCIFFPATRKSVDSCCCCCRRSIESSRSRSLSRCFFDFQ